MFASYCLGDLLFKTFLILSFSIGKIIFIPYLTKIVPTSWVMGKLT